MLDERKQIERRFTHKAAHKTGNPALYAGRQCTIGVLQATF